ncbi:MULTISPECIES: GNAT family N-acetyltransferase [unclassified Microbacterium]|uniref:GNAT family N-acetyltransferase n=1 Tax=unclassified Microbacterium TaxID=2609290 RepID=UPI000A66B2BB|nr:MULTISPECIES: GNAT family N-acetyltransferase [unclassified Microbacterium]
MTDDLAGRGLVVRRVDDALRTETDPWLEAVSRGFLGGERNDVQRDAFFAHTAYRRKIGVFDETAPQPDVPVATFASWAAELTLPGGTVAACAISSVTVDPTHRRRGILRSVMTGELRTAVERGLPVAILTVSESTIYGRFGFAPAALAAQWTIDARRARWVGPDAPGRIDFVTRAQGREIAAALHERVRAQTPGEIDMPGGHWDRFFGTRADVEKAEELRVVQYRSATGDVDGVALYKVTENEHDFAASTVDVLLLVAATDEAYAGLWRFLLTMDLIATVRAGELSVDEPLWWMIADQRAATVTVRDHHYTRILDVPAALSARTYDVADTVVLDVADPLGIASGVFLLTTDADGTAAVELVDEPPVGVPTVTLGVAALSALLLGGVSPVTLARAGRLVADDAPALARLFASTVPPRLSFWY